MKLGIVGLPQSGKTTIFSALTGARGEEKARSDQKMSTVRVVDERVDFLNEMFKPKKSTFAQVEYLLPSEIAAASSSASENVFRGEVRVCDALIHVLRNFRAPGGTAPTPEADFWRLEQEMMLNDLIVAEKRIERLELDIKKGNKSLEEERSLLESCRELLESNQPLRVRTELASAPALRGFTFLSAKPQLVIINNDDEDEASPEWKAKPEDLEMLVVRGRLEMEIATMSPDEAEEFLVEYHIEKSALDRVIRSSYRILNLVSFFTILNEEVRAWTITKGTPALEAADAVHSDMKKGFIRAEVLSFDHLKEYGSFREAKKVGLVRLEGKEYMVKDGDIINFRFNI
jgi:GTP-binding protein YchF